MMEINNKKKLKKYKMWGVIFIPLGIIIGLLAVELFFREGPFFIILFSIPLIVIIGTPVIIILLFFQYYIIPLRRISVKVIAGLIICIGIAFLGKNLYSPSSNILYKRFLPKQTMASASEVQGSIEYPGIDHIVRLSFRISPGDFQSIVERGNYKSSQDDFPYHMPLIRKYSWWDNRKLKTLQQFSCTMGSEFRYLWYDPIETHGWFMAVDT